MTDALIRDEYNRQKAQKDITRQRADREQTERDLADMVGKPVRLTWTEVTEDVDGIPMSVETVVEDGVFMAGVFNRRYPDA